jgi:hypothetical protein
MDSKSGMDSKSFIKEECYYMNIHKSELDLDRLNDIVICLRLYVDAIAIQYYLIAKNYIQYKNISYNKLLELYNYTDQMGHRMIDCNTLENYISKVIKILDNVGLLLDVSLTNTYINIKRNIMVYSRSSLPRLRPRHNIRGIQSIEEIMNDEDDYNTRISRIIGDYKAVN